MELEIEGIVLRQTPYKEKDAIVSVLTKNGIASFYARGILALTSKNASSCLLYAYSRFLLSSASDRLTLRKGELIDSFYNNYQSVEKMTMLGLMSEIVFKVSGDDDGRLYSSFFRIIYLLKENFDVVTLMTIFLAKAILFSGYALQYDECLQCGSKKNIIGVDYLNGGFICAKCNKFNNVESSLYLKTFHYVFKVDEMNFNKNVLNKEICMRLIREFLAYLKKNFSFYRFNAEEMFFEVIK